MKKTKNYAEIAIFLFTKILQLLIIRNIRKTIILLSFLF